MIDYLEQLERDLVEAIDRRDAAPATRRHRRPQGWRGRDWTPAVTTAVALLVIALAVALVEQTLAPPENEQGQPRPVIELRLAGDLARVGPTTLQSRARGPGGDGTLTISATVRLIVKPCCETPPRPAPRSSLTPFTWESDGGSLSGCIRNTISRTPDGHFVWDGPARITTATGALRRYRGFDLRLTGEVEPLLLDQLSAARGRSVSSHRRVALVPPPGC
jgi:hypothetical protein